jgi:hypothetical protein
MSRWGLLGLLGAACGGAPARGPDPVETPAAGCSDLARPLFDFYGTGDTTCGPESPPLRELVPVGGGAFLLWVPSSGYAQLWKPTTSGYGPVSWTRWTEPTFSSIATWAFGDAIVTLHQKNADLSLWHAQPNAAPGTALLARQSHSPFRPTALTRELLALDETHMLVWFPGDGSFTLHRLDKSAASETAALDMTPLASGSHPRFLRGHELVALDSTRLLEWEPRTGDYRIWPVSLADGVAEPFGAAPVVTASRPDLARDLGAGRDVQLQLLDVGVLLAWDRARGELSTFSFGAGADPLAAPTPVVVGGGPALRSLPHGHEPPTRSAIRRVVLVLQRGRSFDYYFGRSCQAPTGAVAPCTEGPACCDAMPESTLGAAACTSVDPATDTYAPLETTECAVDQLHGGELDRFVTSQVPKCGDPRNFACVDPTRSGYVALAARGALADRFFQSTIQNSNQVDLTESNLIYLAVASHRVGSIAEQSGDSINGKLATQGVPWAMYLFDPLKGLLGQKEPLSADAHWSHFRHFEELDRDLAAEALGPVSVVVAPPELAEEPGAGPPAEGAAFVEKLLAAIAAVPRYRDDTLVLVTHLTAGGYYDHVPPPPDDALEIPSQAYGPRVPMLAFGRFVTPGHVSHVQLELSSVTAFLEWNWLPAGVSLGGRDERVNNLGSLLNERAARDGVQVPEGPPAPGP